MAVQFISKTPILPVIPTSTTDQKWTFDTFLRVDNASFDGKPQRDVTVDHRCVGSARKSGVREYLLVTMPTGAVKDGKGQNDKERGPHRKNGIKWNRMG